MKQTMSCGSDLDKGRVKIEQRWASWDASKNNSRERQSSVWTERVYWKENVAVWFFV